MADTYGQRGLDDLYQRGVEDLADRIMGLIYQTDNQISIQELSDFIDAERYADLEEEEQGQEGGTGDYPR